MRNGKKLKTTFILALAVMLLTACSNLSVAGAQSMSMQPEDNPTPAAEPMSLTAADSTPVTEPMSLLTAADPMPEIEALSLPTSRSASGSAQIYLYGELHAVEAILDKEYELWKAHYDNDNMRHLFIEMPYYTAEFLNIWMQSDSDEILDAVYEDWKGSLSYNPDIKEFYRKIKKNCPQTIFHGTDVGHQYDTTGARFIKGLEENGLKDSEQYRFALKVMEQGKYFYDQSADAYRENMMSENFICLFDQLNGESVMGIYGGAHTGLEAMDTTDTVPCMANQLRERYGGSVHSEDLTWIGKDAQPIQRIILVLNEKRYNASYFGKEDITGFRDYAFREIWRLEDAYDDFKDKPKNGNMLPYDNYPMQIRTGEIFALKYTKTDGSSDVSFYRSDGGKWKGKLSTEEFDPFYE